MGFLLMLHSILRWGIVLVGLLALVKFLVGWLRKSEFTKMDRGLSAGFSGLMDLQVTLGFILFFWSGLTGGGFPMFRIEHMTIMLVAAILGHLPTFMKKSQNKFAVALTAVVGALLLVFVGVTRLPGGWSR
jgi:multisubunit Na+/H+ antiporter MnhB subunit